MLHVTAGETVPAGSQAAAALVPTPTREDVTDEWLLESIVARDPTSFATLYDRHAGAAYALAYRILGDSGAEDVVQDAFLALWIRAETYGRARGSVRSWLLAIVHHRAIDLLRTRRHREDRQDPLDDHVLPSSAVETGEEVQRRLEGRQVRETLQQLPPDQQRSIILAYFSGLSQDEISRRLGVPLGTVKGRLRLGLQRMRASLRAEVGETRH